MGNGTFLPRKTHAPPEGSACGLAEASTEREDDRELWGD